MKKILPLLLLILTSCNDLNYKYLNSNKTDIESLLKNINPNKNYDYWEINYCHGITPKTILYKGNKKLKEKYNYKTDCNGFLGGCHPSYCAYNIIYLQNGKWNYVINETDLATFINKIDNPQEAFIIARINDYEIDSNNQKGNGYIKTKNGYNLKLMKYKSCPESKESFIVSIDSTGKLGKTESQGFYLKTKDCIVY
ncbi:hypothetical protein [Flavobacterium hibernum]|uniref:Lipoprotein n=1 Tax=Flavobacterium hibernum TaxID=37752 RepID=A0ABX4C4B9_9FLAO|nr:hypothetical protein [Flavobacterium hibernum]OXA87474.1 hypothetical protein B0A73_11145 [Flavobacterium hibernum]STO14344.1 Uncharacterised protein [Flavobacterium hibernum]